MAQHDGADRGTRAGRPAEEAKSSIAFAEQVRVEFLSGRATGPVRCAKAENELGLFYFRGGGRARIRMTGGVTDCALTGRASLCFFPQGVREVRTYAGGTLPVPGSPRVVATPGHTLGHCSLHLPDRDAIIAGDAVVTLDPYTGARGPRLVARAAVAAARAAGAA